MLPGLWVWNQRAWQQQALTTLGQTSKQIYVFAFFLFFTTLGSASGFDQPLLPSCCSVPCCVAPHLDLAHSLKLYCLSLTLASSSHTHNSHMHSVVDLFGYLLGKIHSKSQVSTGSLILSEVYTFLSKCF